MDLGVLLALLVSYGFPDHAWDTPYAQVGPTFAGALVDNKVLSPSDLTTGNNLLASTNRGINPQLAALWGASDTPQNGRILVRGIKIEIDTSAITPSNTVSLLSKLNLVHKNAERTVFYSLAGYAGSFLTDGNTDTTTAGANQLRQGRKAVMYRLPGPIWVNTNTDVLMFGTSSAVNLGATPAWVVTIDGVAFQTQNDIESNASPTGPQYFGFAVAKGARAKLLTDGATKAAAALGKKFFRA